jgi:hypothetical protein
MQDGAKGLPRIRLLGSRVNKGMRKAEAPLGTPARNFSGASGYYDFIGSGDLLSNHPRS